MPSGPSQTVVAAKLHSDATTVDFEALSQVSSLTAALLGVRRPRRSPWIERLGNVADRLVAAYGVPNLGNFRDPVKEVFYILLSAKTADAQYRKTNRALRAAFPTLRDLASARVKDVRACIQTGGLAGKRAKQIVKTARHLLDAGGKSPSRYLRSLMPSEAFEFLSSLPGLGPKSALCVAMYSLDLDVFPVDVNCQRIAERLGAIPRGLKHYQAQRRLGALVPDGRSRDLHIGMVVHGRTVCLPRRPACECCTLIDVCAFGSKRLAQRSVDTE